MLDKREILPRVKPGADLVLELGCGNRKRHPGSIGIDRIDSEAVDIVGDALEIMRAFPSESARLVTSWHFLEHVETLEPLLREVERVLHPAGSLVAIVPHFSNPYYYSDPTHRTPFGLYTFSYFAEDERHSRRVPSYCKTNQLELVDVTLRFKSARPFYGRFGIKKIVQWIINSSSYMQEFYEENLCYIFPCYEIRFNLRKIESRESSR